MMTEKERLYQRLWRSRNREKCLEYARNLSYKNRVKITESKKRYRSTDKGRDAIKRAVKKYEKLHPERRIAWNISSSLPIYPCVVCGSIKVDRHHPNISKPKDYICLCRLHHKQVDGGKLDCYNNIVNT